MIRKGQRAKVTYCKEATFSSPVSANTKRPQKGKVSNGLAVAQQVTPAVMAQADLHDSNARVRIERIPVNVLKTKAVASGKTMTCTQVRPRFQKKHLNRATKDITLDKLFH